MRLGKNGVSQVISHKALQRCVHLGKEEVLLVIEGINVLTSSNINEHQIYNKITFYL